MERDKGITGYIFRQMAPDTSSSWARRTCHRLRECEAHRSTCSTRLIEVEEDLIKNRDNYRQIATNIMISSDYHTMTTAHGAIERELNQLPKPSPHDVIRVDTRGSRPALWTKDKDKRRVYRWIHEAQVSLRIRGWLNVLQSNGFYWSRRIINSQSIWTTSKVSCEKRRRTENYKSTSYAAN